MKPRTIALGAFLLVLGAALIAVTPVLTEAGLYTAEINLSSAISSGTNSTSLLIMERNTVIQYEFLAVLGVFLSAVGAGLLGYGLSSGESRGPEERAETTPPAGEETPSPSG